jgi:hypothetical protein
LLERASRIAVHLGQKCSVSHTVVAKHTMLAIYPSYLATHEKNGYQKGVLSRSSFIAGVNQTRTNHAGTIKISIASHKTV